MMRGTNSFFLLMAALLLLGSCAKKTTYVSKSRYPSSRSSSSCSSFRYVEKSDNYSMFRNEIKDIVCLDPSYYFFNARTSSYQYNDYSQSKTEQVRKASIKAFAKANINCKYLYPNNGDSLADLISIIRLRAEIKNVLFNFQSENAYKNKECKKTTIKMMGADINISAEYTSLVNLFHCNYFYYTYAEEINHSITLVSALADLSKGKIIYMDYRKMHRNARSAHIKNLLSSSVYSMLAK